MRSVQPDKLVPKEHTPSHRSKTQKHPLPCSVVIRLAAPVCTLREWNHTVCPPAPAPWLHIVFVRFTCMVVEQLFSFFFFFDFSIEFHCMNTPHLCSRISYFLFGSVINHDARNIPMQVFLHI